MDKYSSRTRPSFDDLVNYHPDNINVYNEIKNQLCSIVPFIGAGLSARFYPLWGASLKKIAEKITNKVDQVYCMQLIDKGRYFKVAEFLCKKRGASNLNRDFVYLFSPKEIEGRIHEIRREAVYLLPVLFPGMAITTNLDCLIEKVYEDWNKAFTGILLPGERQAIARRALNNANAHFLFHFHGAINGDDADEESVVFTKSQYKTHYRRCSPLVRELKQWFSHRSMLFLGCSLNHDKTVDVLRRVTGSGTFHYTIINATKDERDSKIRFLEKLHVRAFLYPEGDYEAVRIILEKLIEDTKPKEYENLLLHLSSLNAMQYENRFSYKTELYSLVGRSEELQVLHEFVDAPDKTLWWAVIGPPGSGKSRIVRELLHTLPQGWGGRWITEDEHNNLYGLSHPNQNTLYVTESVQANSAKLGDWIRILTTTSHSCKIRLLLVERSNGDWEKVFRKRICSDPNAYNSEFYSKYSSGFLKVRPLGDGEIRSLMEVYAKSVIPLSTTYTRELPGEQIYNRLIKILHEIDPRFCRPHYALFLMDSWLTGKEPTDWDQEKLLDTIVNNEEEMLRRRVEKVLGLVGEEKLQNTCQTIWRTIIVIRPDLRDLESLLPKTWAYLNNVADRVGLDGAIHLLERLGVLSTDGFTFFQPDILGEYYVLKWINEDHPGFYFSEFKDAVWSRPGRLASFIKRIYGGFYSLLDMSPSSWFSLLAKSQEKETETMHYYSTLLRMIPHYSTHKDVGNLAVSKLKELLDESHDKDTSLNYVLAVRNLTTKQDEAEIKKSLQEVERFILTSWRKDNDFILVLAEIMVNYANKQSINKSIITTRKIKELSARFDVASEEYWEVYGSALLNLSIKQRGVQEYDCITELSKLVSKHKNNRLIALYYGTALSSCIPFQTVDTALLSKKKLELLLERWPHDVEIKIQYSDGLINLLDKLDNDGFLLEVEQLMKLSETQPFDYELTGNYAAGMVKQIYRQDISAAISSIEILHDLSNNHNQTLCYFYSDGLVTLIQKKEANSIAGIYVKKMEELYSEWKTDRYLALQLGFSYFICFQQQVISNGPSAGADRMIQLMGIANSFPMNDPVNIGCKELQNAANEWIKKDNIEVEKHLEKYKEISQELRSRTRLSERKTTL